MIKHRPKYMSYLLRIWQENDTAPWRASLQSAETGERYGFADLKSLFTFLDQQTKLIAERVASNAVVESPPPVEKTLIRVREK